MEPLNKLDCRWNLLRSFRVEAPAGFCDCAQNDASFGRGMTRLRVKPAMTDGRGIGARCTVTLRASRRVQAPPMDLFRGSLDVIRTSRPASISELSDLTGRKQGNLSRTLKTMSHYGLVRMEKKNRALRPIAEAESYQISV